VSHGKRPLLDLDRNYILQAAGRRPLLFLDFARLISTTFALARLTAFRPIRIALTVLLEACRLSTLAPYTI
jgi:hypothetical protein